jgi:hypothetical protein
MKVVLLLSIGMFGFGTVAESHAFGPPQTKSRAEAKCQNKERQERKANLVAELKRGLSQFQDALAFKDAVGDRGLSSLLRVAMEPNVSLSRSALVNRPKGDSLQVLAYYSLLAELVFECLPLRPGCVGWSSCT